MTSQIETRLRNRSPTSRNVRYRFAVPIPIHLPLIEPKFPCYSLDTVTTTRLMVPAMDIHNPGVTCLARFGINIYQGINQIVCFSHGFLRS